MLRLSAKSAGFQLNGKAILVTGRGGPDVCETLRLPYGTEMALMFSALHAGRLLPQEDSWYSFLLEAESTPGP
jgi:hypothetical protein